MGCKSSEEVRKKGVEIRWLRSRVQKGDDDGHVAVERTRMSGALLNWCAFIAVVNVGPAKQDGWLF